MLIRLMEYCIQLSYTINALGGVEFRLQLNLLEGVATPSPSNSSIGSLTNKEIIMIKFR